MAVPVRLFLNKSISSSQRNNGENSMTDVKLELDTDALEKNLDLKKSLVQRIEFPKHIKMRLQLQEDDEIFRAPSIVFQEDPTEISDSELEDSSVTSPVVKKAKEPSQAAQKIAYRKRFTRGIISSNNCHGDGLSKAASTDNDSVRPAYLAKTSTKRAYPVVAMNGRKRKSESDPKQDSVQHSKIKKVKKGKVKSVMATDIITDQFTEETKDKEDHRCALCGKGFQREEQVNVHMRIHTGLKPYECSVCHKGFMQSRELRKHSRLHTGEKLSKCSVCEKVFITKSGLERHMRSHTGEKPYTCFICGKSYRENSVLQGHMRLHTGEKPFMCSLCGKSFHQRAHLYAHMKYHTGEKPHNCSVCGKAYRQKAEVKIHMRVHTGERPHKCLECDKAFRDSGTLKKHMKIHTGEKPWKCSMCGEFFRESGALYKHMRGHTGEKPHKCTDCGKAFREKDVLNRHMRIHTGEKPCRCTVCYKAFRESGALYRHMRTHKAETSGIQVAESFPLVKSSPSASSLSATANGNPVDLLSNDNDIITTTNAPLLLLPDTPAEALLQSVESSQFEIN